MRAQWHVPFVFNIGERCHVIVRGNRVETPEGNLVSGMIWVQGVTRGRWRESHSGEAKRAHDETAAERELERAFRVLGLKEESVAGLSGSAPVKVVLAWWLRRRTTVSLRWVSDRLCMGHYTRVTQAVSRAERRPGRKLNQIKRKLLRLGNAEER